MWMPPDLNRSSAGLGLCGGEVARAGPSIHPRTHPPTHCGAPRGGAAGAGQGVQPHPHPQLVRGAAAHALRQGMAWREWPAPHACMSPLPPWGHGCPGPGLPARPEEGPGGAARAPRTGARGTNASRAKTQLEPRPPSPVFPSAALAGSSGGARAPAPPEDGWGWGWRAWAHALGGRRAPGLVRRERGDLPLPKRAAPSSAPRPRAPSSPLPRPQQRQQQPPIPGAMAALGAATSSFLNGAALAGCGGAHATRVTRSPLVIEAAHKKGAGACGPPASPPGRPTVWGCRCLVTLRRPCVRARTNRSERCHCPSAPGARLHEERPRLQRAAARREDLRRPAVHRGQHHRAPARQHGACGGRRRPGPELGWPFHAGDNVGTGKDYTLFAKADGLVHFAEKRGRKFVSVKPMPEYVPPAPGRLAARGCARSSHARLGAAAVARPRVVWRARAARASTPRTRRAPSCARQRPARRPPRARERPGRGGEGGLAR
eukprot:scaffold373_cov421-Prasinococcus_capsulatus_cf.AAC.3